MVSPRIIISYSQDKPEALEQICSTLRLEGQWTAKEHVAPTEVPNYVSSDLYPFLRIRGIKSPPLESDYLLSKTQQMIRFSNSKIVQIGKEITLRKGAFSPATRDDTNPTYTVPCQTSNSKAVSPPRNK